MTAKENLEAIEGMRELSAAGDWEAYGRCIAEDCVLRIAGVPAALGGRIEGRDAIVSFMRGATGGTFEERDTFSDDNHVCVIGKVTSTQFPGNEVLRGEEAPFTTLQCQVYRLAHGEVTEMTTFVNWMDVYVQTGLIDMASLLR